jgi:hypothetical protein
MTNKTSGYYNDERVRKITYLGLFYDMNIFGLFLEGGIVFWKDNYSGGPGLTYQAGFVFKL